VKKHQFKTIYFPKKKVLSGNPTKVNISIPAPSDKNGWTHDFIDKTLAMGGVEIRQELGEPTLDHLESLATKEHRSLSNVILSLLHDKFLQPNANSKPIKIKKETEAIGVTFSDSLRKGSYGWYPYVEGFSANYARDAILRDGSKPKAIYDPFGGSGTTQLSASLLGIKSYFSELNPFMVEVCNAKVSSAGWAKNNYERFKIIANSYLNLIKEDNLKLKSKRIDLSNYNEAFPDRDFFEENHIRELLAAMDFVNDVSEDEPHIIRLLRLACAANAVACSNMTRRADLRRRKPNEYKNRVVNVSKMITESIERMIQDIENYPDEIENTVQVSNDAKVLPESYFGKFDLVLTSPPYLNGTNYFRNTKIELWLLSLISSEKDLKKYRELTVTGGINDVCKKEDYFKFANVEAVAQKLDIESKDKRIPTMVRHYFSDMFEVLLNVQKGLMKGGKLLLDIGDSKFYGVHVPTHTLLREVAETAGLTFVHEHTLAKRFSRDKTALVQVELVFTKE
tara:strand:- start:7825 stop:9351 length:1527 start_codon:yes stop_codon:yes gene_type:complete